MLPPNPIQDIDPKELVYVYGLSEKELSERLGVSHNLVRKWFCGIREPQLYHKRAAGMIKHNLDAGILHRKKAIC